jgi:hypothetical protein
MNAFSPEAAKALDDSFKTAAHEPIQRLLKAAGHALTHAEREALRNWPREPWEPHTTQQGIIEDNTARNARCRALFTLLGTDEAWALITPQECRLLSQVLLISTQRHHDVLEDYIARFGEWPAEAISPGEKTLGELLGNLRSC